MSLATLKSLLPGGWPSEYLSLDTETTGFSTTQDFVIQVGFVLVRDGKPLDRRAHCVDWSALVPESTLRMRINATRQTFQSRGKSYPFTYEYLKEHGKPPETVFRFYTKLARDAIGLGLPLVGHNIIRFDMPMMEINAQRVGAVFPKPPPGRLIDTMAAEILVQCPNEAKFAPRSGESATAYQLRVVNARMPGIRSSLDDVCAPKYKFAEQGLPSDQMHFADADAFGVHILMRAYAAMAGPAMTTVTGGPPPASPAIVPVNRRGQRRF